MLNVGKRGVRLCSPEVQMKMSKEDAMSFLEDARKDEVKGLKRHVEVNRIEVKNNYTSLPS